MGAGGGGGAAPPAGLSPMQQANFNISKQMVRGNKAFNDPGAMADVRQYGLQMSNLAQGGLLARGMKQVDQVLDAPAMGQGMMLRAGQRMGVAMSPEEQAAMDQQQALMQASNRVGLTNQTRQGLVNAQRDMRFGGINL